MSRLLLIVSLTFSESVQWEEVVVAAEFVGAHIQPDPFCWAGLERVSHDVSKMSSLLNLGWSGCRIIHSLLSGSEIFKRER